MTPTQLPDNLLGLVERRPRLRWWVCFAYFLSMRWTRDACPLMAAALAFFGFFSAFPLALAGVAILADTLEGNQDALQAFSRFVQGFFPGAAGKEIGVEIHRSVHAIALGPSVTTLSLVAFVSLLWGGRAFFATLVTVLGRIWPGAEPRPFWRNQLTLAGLMMGTGILFGLSSAASFGISLIKSLSSRLPGLIFSRHAIVWDLGGHLVAWSLTLLMFYVLYAFAPNHPRRERRRIIFGAAVLATLGWEAAKWVFTHFLGNVARYETTYGSVAGTLVTMLWIYIASLIILLAAEIAGAYEDASKPREGLVPCPGESP